MLHLPLIIKLAKKYMRKIARYLVIISAVVLLALTSTGCFRQDLVMFEDGDFDGMEFSDYDLMHNSELEMDDTDRD